MAPRVYPWVRQWVDAADRLQRLREDRFLNHDGIPLPIGASQHVESPNPQVQYEQCIEITIRISRAVQFLDQIRAEVPYYAESDRSRFIAAGQDENLTLWSPSGIGELFQDIRRLEFLLNSPQTAASIEQQIETADQIDHLRLQIAGRRQKLIGDIDREYHTLAAMLADGGIRTGAAWRRVNCILRFPFVYSGESAEAIVSRRMELLKSIRSSDDSIRTSSQNESTAADSSRSESPAEELNRLAVSYYRLADWQQNPVDESPQLIAGCNPELKQIWRKLYDLLRPAADLSSTASLAQANVANLLLDPAMASLASGSRLQSICEELQRLEFAEFVLWHSRRRGEDFWAGQGRSGTDYFSAAARQYFTLAASVDASSAGLSSSISAKARLTELQTLSDAMSQVPPGGLLKFSSERVLFRGVDQSDVSLSVSPSPGTPEGIASVQLLADESRLRIRAPAANTAGSGTGPLPFSIERIHDLTFSDSLTGELNFRGHRCRLPLAVQSLGSDDGRTVGYTLPASSEGSINVLLGQVSPNATQLLFVLDCSRSMLEDNRLAELKQSLSRLSKQNISNGLNVGIRVFGDRVVWNKGEPASEAAAKTDSRLIMPLQPYSNQPFQQAVSELQAVGETPLYYALLQAQGDFPLGSSGEKQIVVISDGMDNWAAAGESPGLAELKDAYQGSGIRIDCIGFHSDEFGFESLQAISAATGGTCVQITSADSLLDSVFQLANTLQYQIRNVSDASNPKVVQTGNLRFLNQPPYQGTPDQYDVAVLDHRGKLLTPRVPLTLRNGQQLSLVYGGSKLGYQPVDFSAEIASVTNSDAGVTMHVMSADVTDQTNLTVTLGLSHASDPNWWPGFTRISVTPAGSAQPYVFAQGTPNQPRQQFPFWQFTLSDWPQGVTSAEVEIQWAESSGDTPTQYLSDCSENTMAFQPELPDGVELTRREFRKVQIAGSEQNAFMLTLVLAAADRQLGEWSLSVSAPVKSVRRTSNYRANLLNSYFVIAGDQPPERITVYGPSMTAKRSSLKSTIRLTPKTVNANP